MVFKEGTVAVEMRSVIEEQGEKELIVDKHTASYTKRDQIEVIRFTDDKTDFGKVDHMITIHPDKVNVSRTGSVRMNQKFVEGALSECLYRHPYGAFRIEYYTESLTMKRSEQATEINIIYDSEMEEGHKRRHHLTLTYTEEK